MAKTKVFISYKYWDWDVQRLYNYSKDHPYARDYVDYLADLFETNEGSIIKFEKDGEDLTDRSEDYIWDNLKDRIYDSSLTIILITPNMKEENKWEISQWIPWEIEYSLRETTRNDKTSHSNAMIAVIVPDQNGSYEYYNSLKLFRILKSNIDNGYIPVFKWDTFVNKIDEAINIANYCKLSTPSSKIVKLV